MIVRCCHCDGTGTMDGPGGPEECCHCRGKGERWFASESDADVARADLNHEARRVDADQDIGGGHAGMPSTKNPHPVLIVLVVAGVCSFVGAMATLLTKCGGAAQ